MLQVNVMQPINLPAFLPQAVLFGIAKQCFFLARNLRKY